MGKTSSSGQGGDEIGTPNGEELCLRVAFCPVRGVEGASIPLVVGELFVVGRGDDVDPANLLLDGKVTLPDDRISREHTRFGSSAEAGIPTIQDLHSKNGTWLNGVSVTRSPLSLHDVIRIGDSLLVCCPAGGRPEEEGDDPDAEAPPLRVRKEEIPRLWQEMVGLSATISGARDASLMEALLLYPWYGDEEELAGVAAEFDSRLEGKTRASLTLLPHKLRDNFRECRLGRKASPARQAADTSESLRRRTMAARPSQATPHRGQMPTRDRLLKALRERKGILEEVARDFGRRQSDIEKWMEHYEIAPGEAGPPPSASTSDD